ncbi:MAG TPA: START-like domain-containing protein [Paludibacteraceae bacterium]|nr:START-like domain-containing protein [Paludibacteraceae bacterium]HOL00563.1 START-like domain-containing protein [Paludibacteraceae bacterium]HPC26112.1 START-like domain-containing protein [Paludibacteraceae bacterium]HPO67606.1 START-like domain-containing protein [Paludibacteraceae bacterium]HRR62348.1 START-like domain-containing protein [Paludibacteraceae bacterium]
MAKNMLQLEYPLKSASISLLWNKIGTPLGLSEWFANEVIVNDNKYLFKWDNYEETAYLLDIKPLMKIRFQWEDEIENNTYFELKIETNEITGEVALVITDFTDNIEEEDVILLWDKQIDELKRKIGMG